VDRNAPGGIVDQVASQMRRADSMWFVLAPEGTRRKVAQWKTGFWKIARRAEVPVFCLGFNYPDRTIRLGELVTLTDDMEADIRRIRALFAGYQGKHRNV
jgi:1-acyl-sn-glycerol-3-phosphate acyltransferase